MEESKKGHRFKHSKTSKAAKQRARRRRRRQEEISPIGERSASATKDHDSNLPCTSTPASCSRPDHHHSDTEVDNLHDSSEEEHFKPKKLQFGNTPYNRRDDMTNVVLKNQQLAHQLTIKEDQLQEMKLKLERIQEQPILSKIECFQQLKLKEMDNEDLTQKIKRKEQKIRNMEQRLDTCQEHNASMQLRDAEHTFSEIRETVKYRSVAIVDSAIFSDFTHNGDTVLQEHDVAVLNSVNFMNDASEDFYIKGSFSRAALHRFKDGTPVMVKKYLLWEGKDADVKNLQFLSHEIRLIDYIGNHPNICLPIGLVHLKDGFYMALKYEGRLTLDYFLQKYSFESESTVKSIVDGIANALAHLFEKDVLHNNLKANNVLLPPAGDCYRPVLVGFSLACRLGVVKILSKEMVERLSENNHVAPEVISRKTKPSPKSDVYSFGVILRRILRRTLPLSDYPKYKLKRLMISCTSYDPELRPTPNVLRNDVLTAFDDMYAD